MITAIGSLAKRRDLPLLEHGVESRLILMVHLLGIPSGGERVGFINQ
ncbi:MAG: hypothetical protein U0Z53_00170 [Blastocatellia bacterium]